MKLRNQIILVNICIAIGLGLEAARGAPLLPILIAGAVCYAIANLIFLIRVRKSR